MKHQLVFCLLIFAMIGFTFGAKYMKTKAAFIKTCQRKDPQFTACSIESNQKLYKQVAVGLEDLQFDPMKLNKVQVLGDDGPVSINTTITKATVTGFSTTRVVDNDVNPTNWITKLYLPKIRIEGNYEMKGRILILPLNGHGRCWFEPQDSTNEYLNQNWKPVAESLKPIISKSIENILLETLNKIFSFIPGDYFISDIPHPSELYGTL